MNLADELILLLLNEESGYFHQVPGWNLNCAVASAGLAELALAGRIDTDLESLYLVDPTETGDPTLDSILREIADAPERRNTRYWIERLTPRAEEIIDSTLDRLAKRGILKHHSGGFWSLAPGTWQTQTYSTSDDEARELAKTRISRILFDGEIPHPRDVILVGLANACKVLHLIFPLDEAATERIDFVCKMDVVGRSIGDAVAQSMAAPSSQRALRTKPIPSARLRDVLLNRHLRTGNLPALFADLGRKNGPVFRLRAPFAGARTMLVLVGPGVNRWMQRSGRSYLRSKDYLEAFGQVYGASRILPSMDGADHFRMRKVFHNTYSRAALEGRLDELYRHARAYMGRWQVGDVLPAVKTCKEFTNAQFSQLSVGIDTQDDFQELLEFKERSLVTHIQHALPKFMLNTPGMTRRRKRIGSLVERIKAVHTPAQRAGCPRDIVDDLLSLHASDPQFLPETDLPFALVSPLIVSLYLGHALGFALYTLLSRPDLYERIQAEADRAFEHGDPGPRALSKSAVDVTYRFFMESQRLYPVIPMHIRTVMNACTVEGYELPVGSQIFIVQSATHYMEDLFPDPFKFDVDRYLPERREDKGPSYAPLGLGTHMCLGIRWVELQLAVNLLMLIRFFRFEMADPSYKLRINPFPTMRPTQKLKIVVAERRHDLHGTPRAGSHGACPVRGG